MSFAAKILNKSRFSPRTLSTFSASFNNLCPNPNPNSKPVFSHPKLKLFLSSTGVATMATTSDSEFPEPNWITYTDAKAEPGQNQERKFAIYHHVPKVSPNKRICVVFVPGFMSHGQGLKALHLFKYCKENMFEYISYDPEGLGDSVASQTAAMETLSRIEFRHWVYNCEHAINQARGDKVILVGSSLGGMISIKMASKFEVAAMLLIAPAINTLRGTFQLWYNTLFDDDARDRLDRGEVHVFQSDYGPMPVRKAFFENMAEEELDPSLPLPVRCPVTIVHGYKDEVVPYETSLRLKDQLETEDVTLILRKNSEHRMSEPEDLEWITTALNCLIETKCD